MNEATQRYIREHADEDVRQLALRGTKDNDVDIFFALRQIEGRQKARTKLPEYHSLDDILYPAAISLEQCSSTRTAAYKSSLLQGDSIADLSGGFGVDTFAFARKFKTCHYVEPNQELLDLVRHNADVFGISNILYHAARMEDILPVLPPCDCLYIDPSRRNAHGQRVISMEEYTPNLLLWKDLLLQKCRKQIMVKLSPMVDIRQVLRQLPEISDIHIVAINGECKEVLLILSDGRHTPTYLHAIDILPSGTREFHFSEEEESNANIILAKSLRSFLYEPNAAILKAGGFKIVAQRFGFEKLYPSTHLYTSEQYIPDFPGRCFRILSSGPFRKKELRQTLGNIDYANISTRNFPLSPEEIRKQTKLKDGGTIYLWGATWGDGRKEIIITEKAEQIY